MRCPKCGQSLATSSFVEGEGNAQTLRMTLVCLQCACVVPFDDNKLLSEAIQKFIDEAPQDLIIRHD